MNRDIYGVFCGSVCRVTITDQKMLEIEKAVGIANSIEWASYFEVPIEGKFIKIWNKDKIYRDWKVFVKVESRYKEKRLQYEYYDNPIDLIPDYFDDAISIVDEEGKYCDPRIIEEIGRKHSTIFEVDCDFFRKNASPEEVEFIEKKAMVERLS